MATNKTAIKVFDIAEHLRDEEDMQLYLAETLKEGGHEAFIAALKIVAKARGMTQLAKDSGLSRESLYKIFSPDSKPRFDTIMKITSALGVPLTVSLGETSQAQ